MVALGAVLAWAVAVVTCPGRRSGGHAVGTGAPGPVRWGPGEVRSLRFDQALRGYRMGQVDGTLERLALELAERDAEIARLRGEEGPPTIDDDRGSDAAHRRQ
ncbi:hypothetical protein BJF82_16060 [Kytococcus sp. CUA-901]|nr:hypothetical protein BJF82_16060 [Kytococcus sp. CUA-901]